MKRFTKIISGIILGVTILLTAVGCEKIDSSKVTEETIVSTSEVTESTTNNETTETSAEDETELTTTFTTEVVEESATLTVPQARKAATKKRNIVTKASPNTATKKVSTKKSNETLANEVIRGDWGNGTERKIRLTKAGYNYSAIQTIVNDKMTILESKTAKKTEPKKSTKSTKSTAKTKKTTTEKTVETKEAVTTTTTVAITNEIVETTTTTIAEVIETEAVSESETVTEEAQTKKSNEEIAKEVIDGLWDNNEARKKKLTEAGYDYATIQTIVNDMVKEAAKTSGTTDNSVGTSGTTYCGSFRGTYYAYGGPRHGGSGRNLIDCSYGDGNVKGSIASRYFYSNYGYNYNGKRTMVYLEVSGYPQMNGYYYVDDCCGSYNVIDFFYIYNSNCPFQYQPTIPHPQKRIPVR